MNKKIIFIILAIFVAGAGGFIVYSKKVSHAGELSNSVTNKKSIDDQGVVATSTPAVDQQPVYIDEYPHDKDTDGILDVEEEKLGLSDTEFDTDGDGLSDYKEIHTFKTDPKNKDTDGDKYADGYEVSNGFNPNGAGKLGSESAP